MPLRVYDESISVLRRSLEVAKLGHADKLHGMRRLDAFTRMIEQRLDPKANVEALILQERAGSRLHGSRTVFDDRKRVSNTTTSDSQLRLFDH